MDTTANNQGPILSAYLSVNADFPETQRRAYQVRLRDAMKDENVSQEPQRRITEHFETEKHPHARTLAMYAAEDGLLEI